MKRQKIGSKGFTLVELMVVVAMVAVLAAWAVPTFDAMRANYQLESAFRRVTASVNWGRSQAIRAQSFVVLAPTGGQWSGGWTIFVDKNGNGVYDGGDELLRSEPAFPAKVEASGGAAPIKINPSGMLTSGTAMITELTNGIRTRRITISMNRVNVCDPVSSGISANASIQGC